LQRFLHLLRKSVDAHGSNYRASRHGQLALPINKGQLTPTILMRVISREANQWQELLATGWSNCGSPRLRLLLSDRRGG
jgi:hypothetical protein